MRVGRKLHFCGRIIAVVQPVTLFESALERIWIVSGKLWFVAADGARLPVDDEPVDDDVEPSDSDSSAVGASDDEDEDRSRAPGAPVQAHLSCSILVRDLRGLVPLAHAGQYVSVSLVRAGLVGRAPDSGRLHELPSIDTADFSEHFYDVARCVCTQTDKELLLHTIVAALTPRDPLAFIRESRQLRAHGSVFAEKRSCLTDEITVAFHSQRSWLATLGGLIAALPRAVQTNALIAFTAFYQWHANAYAARPALTLTAVDGSAMRLSGAQARLYSAIELDELTRLDCTAHTDDLSLVERLFFGALINRIPLAEHDQALGRWRGVYYNERLLKSKQGAGAAALQRWPRMVAEILDLPLRNGGQDAAKERDGIAFVAWTLYDVSHTLAMRNAAEPGCNTLFSLADIVDHCRAYRNDRRIEQLLAQACTVLTALDVWRRAPDETVVRLAATAAASNVSLTSYYINARTHDVSAQLAQAAFDIGIHFYTTGALPDTGLISQLARGRTAVFYWTARPDAIKGVRFAALPRLLERARHSTAAVADEMCLLAAACEQVVLLEAHLLTEVQLLRFLLLLSSPGGSLVPRVAVVGDAEQYSPFGALALTAKQQKPRPLHFTALPTTNWHPLQQLVHRAYASRTADHALRALVAEQLSAAACNWTLASASGRRWILVANTFASATNALESLTEQHHHHHNTSAAEDSDSDSTKVRVAPDGPEQQLRLQLLKLAESPRRLETTMLLAAPFVGYRGRCVRVLRVYALVRPRTQLDARIDADDCIEVCDDGQVQAVSLDAEALVLELAPEVCGPSNEDHRACCDTWAPNVLCVAMHRAHMCAQSLPLARNALPCDNRQLDATVLVLTSDYNADALCAAAVRATYYARALAVVATDGALTPQEALARRQPRPHTCVGDLYGALLAMR